VAGYSSAYRVTRRPNAQFARASATTFQAQSDDLLGRVLISRAVTVAALPVAIDGRWMRRRGVILRTEARELVVCIDFFRRLPKE
jgi:hypothetical protein